MVVWLYFPDAQLIIDFDVQGAATPRLLVILLSFIRLALKASQCIFIGITLLSYISDKLNIVGLFVYRKKQVDIIISNARGSTVYF